ncbi:putative uridylyltransferase [Planctomycetes bacterium Pan216]|uniref:Putative uridylyltransferase n=1 Tax=Kolteria novifilia TaxID=2527975 RepID=A0A518BAX0_9BACT|nr:putative uridylyltransferase [Planctomycetes bacterium Pan216]
MSAEAAIDREQLRQAEQEHLVRFWDELDPQTRRDLAQQISRINFSKLKELWEGSRTKAEETDPERIEPIGAVRLPTSDADRQRDEQARTVGLEALRAGRVAAVLVAGGQGSRLGFEHPKGMYPIGPVAGTSLFQLFAEKIQAWQRHAGKVIPWYVMTSPTNHEETVAYFAEHHHFGLESDQVTFFTQGTMPAVDAETGRVLLAEKGRIFTSPNGHGGSLLALREEGVLDDMKKRGIDVVYYFQVDNPMAQVLDPEFLGHHLASEADMSVKVCRKRHPGEKVGVVINYDRDTSIIEYTNLPKEMAEETDEEGQLRYWAGNIAIHVFQRPFLERITSEGLSLPFHCAHKAVPHVDDEGREQTPSEPNAIKFEMFVFDAMPMADRVCVVETSREREFVPVKNATGPDSPDEARAALVAQAARWLRVAEVGYPVDADGEPAFAIEISPLAGLSAEEFAEKLQDKQPVSRPTWFGASGRKEYDTVSVS